MDLLIVLVSLVALAIVAVAIVMLFRRPQMNFRRRLVAPQFEAVERALGYGLPQALHSLLGDAEIVTREFFEWVDSSKEPPIRWDVASFLPVDPDTLRRTRVAGADGFCFATNADGEYYYVAAPTSSDPRQGVYLRTFEHRDVPVAASVDELRSFDVQDIETD